MKLDELISNHFELEKFNNPQECIKAIQDKIDDIQKLINSMYSYKDRLRQQIFDNWQKEVKDKFPDLECGMRGDYVDVRFHLDGKNFYVNINKDEEGLFCQVISEDGSNIKDTRIMELEDLLPEHQATISCDLWKHFREDEYDQVFDHFCKVVERCKFLMTKK